MCIKTEKDALALQELVDEMTRVTGAYPTIPKRNFYFGGSRCRESSEMVKGERIILKIPLSCYEQEKKFLDSFFSIQNGEIGIETVM